MAFSDYTSCDSVRAALGINAKEAPDSVIEDGVYLTGMLEALYKISPTLADDYRTARSATNRSAKQTRFVLLADTCCAYVVAIQLIPVLPLLAPQIITDGKTALNRISNPYEHLRPTLDGTLSYLRANLIEAYADVNSSIVVPAVTKRINVLAVGVAVDPVTGQ